MGSIYFRKNSYYKTAFTFISSLLLFAIVSYILAKFFTPYPLSVQAFPFGAWHIQNPNNMLERIQADASQPITRLAYLIPLFIMIGMWFIAFVRLKEKEI